MRIRVSAQLVAVVVLPFAGVLQAQTSLPGGQKSPPSKSGKSKIEFEVPEAAPEPVKVPKTPEEFVTSLIPGLCEYPAGASQHAIDQLVLVGPRAVEPLRAVLRGIDFRPKIASAIALSRLADAESVKDIRGLLTDPRATTSLQPVFAALEALDPSAAREVALEQASSQASRLSRESFRFLQSRLDVSLVPGLRALLSHKNPTVRRQAFELMWKEGSSDLNEDAMSLLGDNDPGLSEASSRYLVLHRNGEALQRLVELSSRDPATRESMWAIITVAEIEDRYSRKLLKADMVPVFRQRLHSLDPLVKLTAAVALAQLGFRGEVQDSETLLGSEVLPSFMETFLSHQYFKDFSVLFPVVRSRVEKITGRDPGEHLVQWRAVWHGEGDIPAIRRDLDPATLSELGSSLVIRFDRSGVMSRGRDRSLVLVGEDHLETLHQDDEQAGALVLSEDEMHSLIELLQSSKLFESGRQSSRRPEDTGAYQMVRVSHENRDRVAIASGEHDAAFSKVEELIEAAALRNFWQRFHLTGDDGFAEYYRGEAPFFIEGADPSVRDRRMLRGLRLVLPALSSDMRIDALDCLWRMQKETSMTLSIDDITLLLHGLSDESTPEGACTMLVHIALDAKDPAHFQPISQFLIRQFGEQGSALLKRLIGTLEMVDECLSHPNVLVRQAAATVSRDGNSAKTESLLAALDDPEPRVVREAILSMAATTDARVRDRLFELACGSDFVRARVALEALGFEGTDAALQILREAVESSDEAIVQAACRGLSRKGGSQAVEVLDGVIIREGVSSQSGISALDSLAEMEDGAAVSILHRYLESDHPELRAEAAYRVAASGDSSAVPVLLSVLDSSGSSLRAREALSLLLSCDGGADGEGFLTRYQAEPSLDSDVWFTRALEIENSFESDGRISDSSLIQALRDNRWYVRQNSAMRLTKRYGSTFGSPRRYALESGVNILADRWEAYLSVPPAFRVY